MVGGMVGSRIHFRANWKWRVMLNICAYSVKDPSTLTANQKFSRLYRSCLRRHYLLNVARMRWAHANHKNYFEHVEECRQSFEKAKSYSGEQLENFIKETEEWLELTFFPAVSQWPTRLFSNKYALNVAYPDEYHEFDPVGYYKPRPIQKTGLPAGPFFQDYPLNPHFFALNYVEPRLDDPYLKEHLDKIEDPDMKEKAANRF